jgi:hypothetical protein
MEGYQETLNDVFSLSPSSSSSSSCLVQLDGEDLRLKQAIQETIDASSTLEDREARHLQRREEGRKEEEVKKREVPSWIVKRAQMAFLEEVMNPQESKDIEEEEEEEEFKELMLQAKREMRVSERIQDKLEEDTQQP